MAKTKKSKKKTSKSKSKSQTRGQGVPRLLITGKMLIVLGLMAGLGAGFYLGGRAVVRSVVRDPAFRLNPVRLNLRLPPCVTQEIRDELGVQLGYLNEMSIFEPRLPALVARALENSPWILRVNRVERTLPNRLHLEMEFRKPAGIVQTDGSLYLVDAEGYWLPSRYFQWPYKMRPPVIVGRDIDPWPRRGKPWRSPAVRAGAVLTQFLLRHQRALDGVRITKIDLTNLGARARSGESCVLLHTKEGALIKWGCSPVCGAMPGTCSRAGELTDEQKLANLRRVLRLRPGLRGCKIVDLRFTTPVIEEAQPTVGE